MSVSCLWVNVHALVVLKLKDNEGVDNIEQDFNLLFAASGNIRNVTRSVVGLPDGGTRANATSPLMTELS